MTPNSTIVVENRERVERLYKWKEKGAPPAKKRNLSLNPFYPSQFFIHLIFICPIFYTLLFITTTFYTTFIVFMTFLITFLHFFIYML